MLTWHELYGNKEGHLVSLTSRLYSGYTRHSLVPCLPPDGDSELPLLLSSQSHPMTYTSPAFFCDNVTAASEKRRNEYDMAERYAIKFEKYIWISPYFMRSSLSTKL